ncbi:MAG TPA: hypothetical protein VKR54_00160 [Candidatus Babeliales bacterium]|jgi:hypothetical protein|nr:hypothetical protein [Candidatus Babeliales bacterium]
MKKYLALVSVFFIAPSQGYEQKVFAHSFMYTKPGYYDVVMEQALWHDIAYNKKGSLRGGIQAIPFFQQSMPRAKNARYFLMKDKNELLVAGDDTPYILKRDIRAEWVGLPDNFSGVLSLNPKQQQKGCMFEYHQDLKNWVNVAILRDLYITIFLPVSETHNSINLRQTDVVNPQESFPQNIIEAFNQPSWCFSRITNTKKHVGLAELRIKFGTSYISEDYFQLNYYSVIAVPTGNKQNGKTMFESVNGNNHHLGIGAGISIQAPLNRDTTEYAWCFFLDLESVILIRNKQFRTYDLFGKPWSRFLLINTPNIVNDPIDLPTTTNLPGVNFLTQKITAKPFNVVDFALGWRMSTDAVEAEFGYGIWGHGRERTNLNHPETQIFGIAGSAPGKTASRSTIAQQAADDLNFVPILRTDLDPQSGESGGGFNNRLFMSVGWVNKGTTTDSVLGLGGSVDFPFENSLLQLWKIWIKLSATF